MPLTEDQAGFLRSVRVARLATIGADGGPHVVPVCPVVDDGEVVIALEAGSLKSRNARGDPRVSLVADDYGEDWDALAGVVIRGRVRFLEGVAWTRARALLYEKFTQYECSAPIDDWDVIAIDPEHVASWGL